MRYGFHTNRGTKAKIITELISAVRENRYVERCAQACDELETYRRLPNGSYAAAEGCHDDMLITRAIALYVTNDSPAVSGNPAELLHRPRW